MTALDPGFQSYLQNKKVLISPKSAAAVLALQAEGGTVPFIARYRKEKTGNLDEVQVRTIIQEHELWVEVVKRKAFILEEIEKQENLTPELKKQIEASFELVELEELYRPFKRKKKTKAKLAKDAGLEPFADWLWGLGHGTITEKTALEVKAKEYINPTAGYATYDEVLRGAQHIIVEKIQNNADLRKQVKEDYFTKGMIFSKKGKSYKPNSKFDMYLEFKESVKSLESPKASHRYLAIRRGWQEGELTVTIEGNDNQLLAAYEAYALSTPGNQVEFFLKNCAKVALTVHVIPSVTNELHKKLKELADNFSIDVFASNVRRVLMASPFGPKVVLGVDPGLKTGCKLALLDNSGQFISSTVLDTLGTQAEERAKKLFSEVLKQVKIEVIAVGNGTGGREAEIFIRKVLKELDEDVPVILVNESGASVYSASDVAREEFPDLDLTIRGAISIARRLQDPLAELVKIEPKSIGVGQYQHDVSQTQLKKSLYNVVESCVNQVGVNINTASASLLQYVSGIGPAVAKNIIEYRNTHGLFKGRDQFLKVPNFSSKTFEQAAGFLRVPNGDSPLDTTGIHPERYSAIREMATELKTTVSQLIGSGAHRLLEIKDKWIELIGEFTFNDIIEELQKPGRDPRDPYKIFKFREDIHEVKDLQKDMVCPGVVTNVTNFGAFVDVGVHQDGLVHLSQISHEFIDDPKKVLSPGDQVQVKVLGFDLEKNQVSLTMLLTEKPAPKPRAKPQKSSDMAKNGRDRKNESRSKNARSTKNTGKGRSGSNKGSFKGGNKPRRPANPFNNPFAALTEFKK